MNRLLKVQFDPRFLERLVEVVQQETGVRATGGMLQVSREWLFHPKVPLFLSSVHATGQASLDGLIGISFSRDMSHYLNRIQRPPGLMAERLMAQFAELLASHIRMDVRFRFWPPLFGGVLESEGCVLAVGVPHGRVEWLFLDGFLPPKPPRPQEKEMIS